MTPASPTPLIRELSHRIRPATRGDVVAVAAIERATFSDPWSASAFRAVLDAPRSRFLVAETSQDETIVGYTVAWFVRDEGEIANLAVSATARGRGIGSGLLDALLAQARAREIRSIYLEVRDSNARARWLYRSRGFDEIGRRRRYYRGPVEDAIIMRRAL